MSRVLNPALIQIDKMPRENRKRGKKHKRQLEQPQDQQVDFKYEEEPESIIESPSWIVSGPNQEEETNPEAPYGYVDADVKAYFRTVDVQICDWQEKRDEAGGESEDIDPNERMLPLSFNCVQLLIAYYRETFILYRCTGRNAWQRETTCNRPGLFSDPRENDIFYGRLRAASFR